jgi:hypothetical protein
MNKLQFKDKTNIWNKMKNSLVKIKTMKNWIRTVYLTKNNKYCQKVKK